MERRSVLKNLGLIVGGAMLLPSCVHKGGSSYVQLKYIEIKEDQQNLVAEICETIIPRTHKPGAKNLDIPAFVLKLVDDCFDKKAQGEFLTGLKKFDDFVKTKYGSNFRDLSKKDREAALIWIEKEGWAKKQKTQDETDVENFYSTLKQQTIFGYTTSKFFMTKEIVYELVPGRYNAHFPVKSSQTV